MSPDPAAPGAVLSWPARASAALRADVHRVLAAVAALGGAVGFLSVPGRSDSDAWLDDVLRLVRRGDAALAVVSDGGRVQALGQWRRMDAAVLAHNAVLRQVMTHPEARGLGRARLVVDALVQHARVAGIETLTLDVRGNNHVAMALYEAAGFSVYGRLPDFIAVGPHRFDRVCYRLDLGRAADVRRHGGRSEGPGSSALSAPGVPT